MNLLTASLDHTTRLWNIESGKLISINSSPSLPTSSALSPCGNLEVLGLKDSSVVFKEFNRNNVVQLTKTHSDGITSIAISKCGRYLLSGSKDTTAVLYDIEQSKDILTYSIHSDGITSVSISPNNDIIVTSSKDGKV